MSEHKQGFLGKVKETLTHSKNDATLKQLYRAGRKQAESELGVTRRALTTSLSSDDTHALGKSHKHQDAEVVAAAAAAGTVAGHRASESGHASTTDPLASPKVHSGSSKGKVISHPPPINREPLEQDYGGDFTDGKAPTDLAQENAVTNSSPRYENKAHPVSGHGQFFDPSDTQGGYYTTNTAEHKDKSAVGAGAGTDEIVGGVAVKHYGKDTEATQAELTHRDLRTKPLVYAQIDAQNEHQSEIEQAAYKAGQKKGKAKKSTSSESRELPTAHASSDADPSAEHDKNKSLYNKGGVAQVVERLKGHKDTDRGTSSTDGASHNDRNAAVGAAGAAGAVAGSQHGNKSDKSGKDYDYDAEMKRLDENIAQTQREIDALGGSSGAGQTINAQQHQSSGSADASRYALTNQANTSHHTSNAAAGGAVLGGVALGSAAGHHTKLSETNDFAGANTSSTARDTHHSSGFGSSYQPNASEPSTQASAEVTSAEVEKLAYNAGHKSAQPASGSYVLLNTTQTTTDTPAGTHPGILDGAKGAAAALGAAAVLAFGLDHSTESSKHDVEAKAYNAGQESGSSAAATTSRTPATATTSRATAPATNSAALSAAQDTGFTSADATASSNVDHAVAPATLTLTSDRATAHYGSTSGIASTGGATSTSGVTSEDASNTSYMDSAKAAIAAAGVAAAGAFGYEGYNEYYKNSEANTPGEYEGFESAGNDSTVAGESVSKNSSAAGIGGGPSTSVGRDTLAQTHNKEDFTKLTGSDNDSTSAVVKPVSQAQDAPPPTTQLGGLLSKLGWGSSDATTESPLHLSTNNKGVSEPATASESSGNLNNERSIPEAESNKSTGVGAAVAGAVAGAAGAVGLSLGRPKSQNVESLVEVAAENYDDVAEKPKHKTKGNALKQTATDPDAKLNLPEGLQPQSKDGSQSEKSGYDNTKLEKDIAAHNRGQQFSTDKNLVEVAEEKYPEIRNAGTHSATPTEGEEDTPRHRTPPGI